MPAQGPSTLPSSSSQTLELRFKPTVSSFISAIATGKAREIACFGARGDGKTVGALAGMVAHAQGHHAAGYPLPTRWLGVTGTFQAHREKTHDSLRDPLWRGTWDLKEGGHTASFRVDGTELVNLRLIGLEDAGALDRVRTQCHCTWFEEPAPAADLGATGMSDRAWGMAISSMRLPSHANVATMTSNYPDEEHWTWERFVVQAKPGTLYFRVPPGELASAEARQAWADAITDPVMRRRLIDGKPGTIIPGRPVAYGFNEDIHVSRRHLKPSPHTTLWMGQDGGLMPATVIGQRANGCIEILASLTSEHAGIRQHFKYVVIPWLGEHAPWVLEDRDQLYVVYDPALNTDEQGDSETNALRVARELLPAHYRPGVNVPWSWRRDPLLAALSAMDDGHPLVQIDPEFCKPLIKSWRGMWHYAVTVQGGVRKEEPKKPNPPWADIGDASAYLIAGMAPTKPARNPNRPKPSYVSALDENPLARRWR